MCLIVAWVLVCQVPIFCVILLQGSLKSISALSVNWEEWSCNILQFVWRKWIKKGKTPLQTVNLMCTWSFFQQEHYFLFLFIRRLCRYLFFSKGMVGLFWIPWHTDKFNNISVLKVCFVSYDNFLHVGFLSQNFSNLSIAQDFEAFWNPFL